MKKNVYLLLAFFLSIYSVVNAQISTNSQLRIPSSPTGNPLITSEGNADPSVRIFNGTAYLYPSHDYAATNNDWIMYDWKTYSSTDLVNWTDKGIILKGSDIKWASYKYYLWAPDCIYNNGSYYFYFPIGIQDVIGVAKSASPSGPFKDALGRPLVGQNSGFGRAIDPAAFIDDNGRKYLLWGNYDCNIAELNDDMISFKSSITKLTIRNAPAYAEGPWLFKRNGIYYLFYSKDGTYDYSSCDYATATTIMGPYQWKGTVVAPTSTIKGTGHGSIFQFHDQWYVAYAQLAPTPYYRKTNIDYLFFKDNGDIQQATPTDYGVGRHDGNKKIEAEKYFEKSNNINYRQCSEGGFYIGTIENGNWIKYPKVDLGAGKTSCDIRAASGTSGGMIEIRKDSATGELLGTIKVNTTGGDQIWQTFTSGINQTSGINDIYLVFKGGSEKLFNINWFRFSDLVSSSQTYDTESIHSVAIYPNPFNSTATIEIKAGNTSDEMELVLYNILSREIKRIKNISNGMLINRDEMEIGIYFYKLISKNKQLSSGKLIIQ